MHDAPLCLVVEVILGHGASDRLCIGFEQGFQMPLKTFAHLAAREAHDIAVGDGLFGDLGLDDASGFNELRRGGGFAIHEVHGGGVGVQELRYRGGVVFDELAACDGYAGDEL